MAVWSSCNVLAVVFFVKNAKKTFKRIKNATKIADFIISQGIRF